MRTARRIVIPILLFVGTGALAYWVTLTLRQQPRPRPEPPKAAEGAEVVMTSPDIKHSEGGKLAWKFILDEVELQTGASGIEVKGVNEGLIYDQFGKPAMRVSAKQVRGDTNRKDFEVSGDVTVTSPKGMVITTESVKWLNAEQRLHCPGPVVMKGKNLVITTTRLDYWLAADKVKCPNRVRMYSGNNRVTGSSLTYDVKTGITDIVGGIQMVIVPEEAKRLLKELGSQ